MTGCRKARPRFQTWADTVTRRDGQDLDISLLPASAHHYISGSPGSCRNTTCANGVVIKAPARCGLPAKAVRATRAQFRRLFAHFRSDVYRRAHPFGGNRVMRCSERRVAPLVHCGPQAWVTAENHGELGESGVQVLDAPRGVVHLRIRVVAGGVSSCGC